MKRYLVKKYGQFLYTILDTKTHLLVKKEGVEQAYPFAYGKDGKALFVTFNTKEAAENYCDKLNAKDL